MRKCIRRKASRLLLLLITGVALLAACGGTAYSRSHHAAMPSVVSTLKNQYAQWRGVPYHAGGQSKKGVDCSGFVQLTFRDRFHMDIPRTTRKLSSYGKKIRRSSLRPGDLVFFRIGFRKRHVGIYVEKDTFIHASTSRGVMISSLNEDYWDDHFWQARRVM